MITERHPGRKTIGSPWGVKYHTAQIFKENGMWFLMGSVEWEEDPGSPQRLMVEAFPTWQAAIDHLNSWLKSLGAPTRLF